MKIKKQNNIKAHIEYIDNISELVELGVMGSPALVINGIVANVGMLSNERELLDILKKH
jgi:glutaredoxin